MNKSGADFLWNLVGVIVIFVVICFIGSAFGDNKEMCMKSGCRNPQESGSIYCKLHELSSYQSLDGTSSDSTYDSDSTSGYSSGYSSSSDDDYSSNADYSNSYRSEMYDYDNADDYADDYAEDYAIDEFGDADNEEAYDYGYDEAYDDWEDEMDE